MKWIGISGGWRKTNQKIENDVRGVVSEIMQRGDGIVSGGALNVDYIALDEALKQDKKAKRVKIFIPTTLEKYTEHYQKHAKLGNITLTQAERLAKQLTKLKEINSDALIEELDDNFNERNKKEKYYKRNQRVIDASDELIAFHIKTKNSDGLGTMDTFEKARVKNIPVKIYSYSILN